MASQPTGTLGGDWLISHKIICLYIMYIYIYIIWIYSKRIWDSHKIFLKTSNSKMAPATWKSWCRKHRKNWDIESYIFALVTILVGGFLPRLPPRLGIFNNMISNNDTVDGWNPKQPHGMYETPINNGINYQAQLVSRIFLPSTIFSIGNHLSWWFQQNLKNMLVKLDPLPR